MPDPRPEASAPADEGAHVFARFASESPARMRGPVWLTYRDEERKAAPFDAVAHATLLSALRESLGRAGVLRPR